MVCPDPLRYVVLMDWGSAGWGVEVDDLGGVPLDAVVFMLEGYREIASLEEDSDIEACILWRHVQLGLMTVPRSPLPGLAWAERPLNMLLDTLHFFAADPPALWHELVPSGEVRQRNLRYRTND